MDDRWIVGERGPEEFKVPRDDPDGVVVVLAHPRREQ